MTSKKKEQILIDKNDLKESVKIKGLIGSIIVSIAIPVLSLNKINKSYNKSYHDDPHIFLDNIFKNNNNTIKYLKTDINNIP